MKIPISKFIKLLVVTQPLPFKDLLHKGIKLLTISHLIGHRDMTVIIQTYSHLLQEKEKPDFDTIKKIFGVEQRQNA